MHLPTHTLIAFCKEISCVSLIQTRVVWKHDNLEKEKFENPVLDALPMYVSIMPPKNLIERLILFGIKFNIVKKSPGNQLSGQTKKNE